MNRGVEVDPEGMLAMRTGNVKVGKSLT